MKLSAVFPAASVSALALLLSGCAPHHQEARTNTIPSATASATGPVTGPVTVPVDVTILAFNDFHGNLEPPHKAITTTAPDGTKTTVPAGGAAYLASAIRQLRAQYPGSILVSAGDLIGASPLVSSLFLDEPTIEAMDMIGLDFNAVGNHELDHGEAELLRKQNGGCEQHGNTKPCQITSPFPGAKFRFLAGNTLYDDGRTLFPAYGIKTVTVGGQAIRMGFIGLTLKGTADIVSKEGIRNLHFTDEAAAANALVPKLRAEGADSIVLLIHQGGNTDGGYNDKSCPGLTGDIVPILDRLDPSIDVVVSGHTHQAYICDYGRINPAKPFLLTSGGQYGTLLTHISLSIDPATKKVVRKSADNLIIQGEGFVGPKGEVPVQASQPLYPADPAIGGLVSRYAQAAHAVTSKVIGHIGAPLLRESSPAGEQILGSIIADAQLAATSAPDKGGAQIAFMNLGGVRADIVPGKDGAVTFGQIYAVQPFGNMLTTRSYSGQQLRAILEQQFSGERPRLLQISHSLRYRYDLSRPVGQRVTDIWVQDKPVKAATLYRITSSDFLAGGADGFSTLTVGTNLTNGPVDVEALQDYIAAHQGLMPPKAGRIINAGATTPARR
ncbi:MAG: bifunctional metallophosphatase/5'-nucleotidase [Sphingobium sp.]|nr:bifunctional metallophosphatase/5'-nucleotidase [Sphingobium sp.]